MPRPPVFRKSRPLRALGPEARDFVNRCFLEEHRGAARWTYDKVREELKTQFGAEISVNALHSYHQRHWFPGRLALEQTDRVVAGIHEAIAGANGRQMDEAAAQALRAYVLQAMQALQSGDPATLYDLLLRQQRVEVERDKLDLERERRAAVDRPGLFLEFFRLLAETVASDDPAAAEVLQRHFDKLMARIKETAPA